MPKPKPDETKQEYLKRCIPIVIAEGTAKNGEQASAICNSMWSKRDMSAKAFPVEVMSVGTWNEITFTIKDLNEIASNFKKLRDIIKPPVKLGHTPDKPGAPAYGWVSDLSVKGDKLIATLSDLPEKLLNAIRAKRYKRVSSEIFFEYTYNGVAYGKVFAALALLGAEEPAVKNLEDLQAYLTQNFKLGKFEKIEAFDTSSEFILADHILMEDINMPTAEEKLRARIVELTEQNVKLTKLTEENTQLKADLNKLEKKQFEEKKKRRIKDFTTFCENQVKKGRMLPAQRDLFIKDYEKNISIGESGNIFIPIKTFMEHIKLADKVMDKKEYAKDRKGSNNFSDVQEEADKRTKQFMAEKGEKDYVVALDAVLDLDPDLADRYYKDTNRL